MSNRKEIYEAENTILLYVHCNDFDFYLFHYSTSPRVVVISHSCKSKAAAMYVASPAEAKPDSANESIASP